MSKPSDWNPSETLYAFAGWLTSRYEPITMSAVHDAAPVADLVAEFIKRHDLPDPRQGWENLIVPAPGVVRLETTFICGPQHE